MTILLHKSVVQPCKEPGTMRVVIAVGLASLACALRPSPIAIRSPIALQSSSFSTPYRSRNFDGVRIDGGIQQEHKSQRRTCIMSASPQDDSAGPFTRGAFLEGATKAAGVLGAGTFVQRGLFAGVPYNGKPDLSGKVSTECLR